MVLVLEPDPIIHEFLVAELRDAPDLTAHAVATAAEALDALRGARIPVVLFDLPLFPGEAAALARRLREAVAPWGGALVATTTDPGGADADAVRGLGVPVLGKPFADGEPLATIRRLVGHPGRRRG
jgi:DNA-binding response OmpR family regulator